MATHSSVLAWRIPGTGKPGRLPFMESHRVGTQLKRLSSSSSSIPIVLIHTHIHHIFLIYSPADGQLGCFCIMTTVNNATINTGVHVSFKISVLFCFWLYAQEWNCWVTWQYDFQFFVRPPYCFPQWRHQFTSSPIVYKGSLPSTSPPFVCVLEDSHPER